MRATIELKEVALRELTVAQRLAEAELRRFEAGTSDYLLLNVRERSLGEAQKKRWQAELNHQVALANYYGVSMGRKMLWESRPIPRRNKRQQLRPALISCGRNSTV